MSEVLGAFMGANLIFKELKYIVYTLRVELSVRQKILGKKNHIKKLRIVVST
jgi:hypothetical protein